VTTLRRVSPGPTKRRCVLQCALHGTRKCEACSLPDDRGAVHCPNCGGPLFYITATAGQARLACSNLTGCGRSVVVPIGNVNAALRESENRQQNRREQVRNAVRRHRSRQQHLLKAQV